MAEPVIQVKKVTRRRTIKQAPQEASIASAALPHPSSLQTITELFADLLTKITQYQSDFEKLQRQVDEVRQSWAKEQKDHQIELEERNRQEELQRQREKDNYLYEMARERKKAEDDFADKKAAWEKELRDQKEAIGRDRTDLAELRSLVAGFEKDKEKAIKEACDALQAELMEKFMAEKRLREQEIKAEKEILNLKIAAATAENSKLTSEVASLKQKLDEATRQLKEIAVKVIESRGNLIKTPVLEE
ncbi:hypothetical protein HYU92_00640 [Candidatus Curtissbacteria bacterium]|nr:hypothetical protein [Candidatus Curtissbacteria bacterium]